MQGYSSLQPGQTVWRMCHLTSISHVQCQGRVLQRVLHTCNIDFPPCVSLHGRPGAALPVEPAPSVHKTAYMSMQNLHIDWTCMGLRYGLLHGDRDVREKLSCCSMQSMH